MLQSLKNESELITMNDKNTSEEISISKTENNLIDIEKIYDDIRNKIIVARSKMLKHIDTTMVEVYWYVRKITYELSENSNKASNGRKIIEALSSKLANEFGGVFCQSS